MTREHDTGRGHHNPSNPQSNTSIDCKLAIGKDESFISEIMKNKDTTDIMDELATMIQPPNQLRSSIPESTLHRISKMVMKEAVEDKKMELIRSGMKIPENDVDVLDLIDTSDLYGMINEGINKHYQRDTAQRVTNDMVNITNVSITAHSNNEATYAGQEEINDLKVVCCMWIMVISSFLLYLSFGKLVKKISLF